MTHTASPGIGGTGIEVTGSAQRDSWDGDRLPPVERVRPGLWSVPVPIPSSPLRYVLVYVLELTGGGIALVDAGWNTDDAWNVLVAGLATTGHEMTDVRAVLVTHIHPDHYGLAGRVREASGAWIGLHPADAALIPGRYGDGVPDQLDGMRRLLETSGAPADEVAVLANSSMQLRQFVSTALPDVLLNDGDRPELPGWDLTAIWTPGHSPGHLCFASADRKLFLSGDHVLPRITPNITIHTQQRPDPIADFLESLAAVGTRYDDSEVLPAHEWRFRGLAARVTQLTAHHHERSAEIAVALRERPGATCWQISEALTWSRPWSTLQGFLRRMAAGETLAHLVNLQGHGAVRAEHDSPTRWYAT